MYSTVYMFGIFSFNNNAFFYKSIHLQGNMTHFYFKKVYASYNLALLCTKCPWAL